MQMVVPNKTTDLNSAPLNRTLRCYNMLVFVLSFLFDFLSVSSDDLLDRRCRMFQNFVLQNTHKNIFVTFYVLSQIDSFSQDLTIISLQGHAIM